MNPTQWQTSSASLIAFLAGIAAGRGWFGFDTNTWITILTSVVGLAGTVWAAVAARKSAIVTTVANLPEVSKVTLISGVAGTSALYEATPDNVKVQG